MSNILNGNYVFDEAVHARLVSRGDARYLLIGKYIDVKIISTRLKEKGVWKISYEKAGKLYKGELRAVPH